MGFGTQDRKRHEGSWSDGGLTDTNQDAKRRDYARGVKCLDDEHMASLTALRRFKVTVALDGICDRLTARQSKRGREGSTSFSGAS